MKAKNKKDWAEKVEQLPLIVKLLATTALLPVLVVATIGLLYKSVIESNRFVKKKAEKNGR